VRDHRGLLADIALAVPMAGAAPLGTSSLAWLVPLVMESYGTKKKKQQAGVPAAGMDVATEALLERFEGVALSDKDLDKLLAKLAGSGADEPSLGLVTDKASGKKHLARLVQRGAALRVLLDQNTTAASGECLCRAHVSIEALT
jgi:hypothetical protein